MARIIGLSRNLKMAWLNKSVQLLSENLSEKEYKDSLNTYLSFEIKSPTNLRKTREILMNLWYYENPKTNMLRLKFQALLGEKPDNALIAHWCVLLATYPIFADVAKVIGRFSDFEDEFTLKQLKEKIFDEWGERATLFHSIDKMISTMKDFGVLCADKPGHYSIVRYEISDDKVNALLAATGICIKDKEKYTLQQLRSMSYMFPFSYHIKREMLMTNDLFKITNVGGKMMVGLADKL